VIALAIISIFLAGMMIGMAVALLLLRKTHEQQTLIQSIQAVDLLKEEISVSLGRLGQKSKDLSLQIQAQRGQQ
jgi:hypothetical protein